MCSLRHKHWPAGLAHFSDRWTSSGQYISSFTGPYGPPRYMSGQQISNSAGPNDDKSQYVLFAGVPAPHLGSFRAVILLQGNSTSNEQIFRSPHALFFGSCSIFLSGLPNYPNEQIQNLSFLLQIVFQLKLFP